MTGDDCCLALDHASGNLCRRLCRAVRRLSSGAARRVNSDLASDCEQEALVYLWSQAAALRSLPDASRCGICEFRVAQHVADILVPEARRAKPLISVDALRTPAGDPIDMPDDGPAVDDIALSHFRLAGQVGDPQLAAALAALTPREKQVLDLAFTDDLTCAALAARLGISPQAALQARGRALRHLRSLLGVCARGGTPRQASADDE